MRSAFFTVIFLSLALHISGNQENGDSLECDLGSVMACYNKPAAMRLKIISIAAILVTGMLGVCLPLFTRSIPALHPEKDLFVVVKAFASGVILATGYMHVLPDSFDCLKSQCLPANPWAKFPFTTFVAMLSAIVTLMVDSFTMALYRKSGGDVNVEALVMVHPTGTGTTPTGGSPCQSVPKEALHLHQYPSGHEDEKESSLLRFRVVAQVLEVGIIVHSVVIGLSLGASENPCTIRPLIAALCFHQMFEGMGLGGCILQAEYGMKMKAIMVFFFSFTTPLGIALGIGLSNVYSDESPTALIVVGLLNASSAGLLNYMALVNLLAVDFMGRKLQSRIKLQIWSYVAVLLGAGGMSVMAIWA